jgi:cellulose synthase/poly-beta-1,6-N-acetylglucosamine synthase-like glycosyltransferase
MALTADALAAAGGLTDDLTEDLSLNVRLNLAGHRAVFLHHVRVRDEKPARADDALTQRARWVRGKREVQRVYGRTLLAAAVRRRSPALLDLLFRLYNPGRSALALALVVLTGAAWLAPGIGLWPLPVLATVTGVVVLLPAVFLVIDHVPARYVVRYPFVALVAILWLPIRVASRFVGGWRRTRHTG